MASNDYHSSRVSIILHARFGSKGEVTPLGNDPLLMRAFVVYQVVNNACEGGILRRVYGVQAVLDRYSHEGSPCVGVLRQMSAVM